VGIGLLLTVSLGGNVWNCSVRVGPEARSFGDSGTPAGQRKVMENLSPDSSCLAAVLTEEINQLRRVQP